MTPTFKIPQSNALLLAILVFETACSGLHAQLRANASEHPQSYPDHWWARIERTKDTPTWEILPHEANRNREEVILSKRNELGILSNFAATPFFFGGKQFASLEGFWQGTKFPEGPDDERNRNPGLWKWSRAQVEAMTAFDAKRAGDHGSKNMKALGVDWVTFNGKRMTYREGGESPFYNLIVAAMQAKLDQNPKVRSVLLSTGNLTLKPDHQDEENGPKAWKYCQIWMELRKSEQAKLSKS